MFSTKHHEQLFAAYAKSTIKVVPSTLTDAGSHGNSSGKAMTEVVGANQQNSNVKNESLEGNKCYSEYVQRIKNTIQDAYVAFVDISGFSSKIKDWSAVEVKEYLEDYYKLIFPIIKEYKGQIDKIMGDGILVIFSDVFGLDYKKGCAGKQCLAFCKKCIEALYDKNSPVKASIGSGKLFFVQTGVDNVYEECSCIGHPMTIAFRLEDKAQVNQILIFEDDPANDGESCDLLWTYHNPSIDFRLKGLDEKIVRIYCYEPKQKEAGEKLCPSFHEYLRKNGV